MTSWASLAVLLFVALQMSQCKLIIVNFDYKYNQDGVVLRCTYDSGNGNPDDYQLQLRVNNSDLYKYGRNGVEKMFFPDALSDATIDLENSNGTILVLKKVKKRITGMFGCSVDNVRSMEKARSERRFSFGPLDPVSNDESNKPQHRVQRELNPFLRKTRGPFDLEAEQFETKEDVRNILYPQSSYGIIQTSFSSTPSSNTQETIRPHKKKTDRFDIMDFAKRTNRYQDEASTGRSIEDKQAEKEIIRKEYLGYWTRVNLIKIYSELDKIKQQLNARENNGTADIVQRMVD